MILSNLNHTIDITFTCILVKFYAYIVYYRTNTINALSWLLGMSCWKYVFAEACKKKVFKILNYVNWFLSLVI